MYTYALCSAHVISFSSVSASYNFHAAERSFPVVTQRPERRKHRDIVPAWRWKGRFRSSRGIKVTVAVDIGAFNASASQQRFMDAGRRLLVIVSLRPAENKSWQARRYSRKKGNYGATMDFLASRPTPSTLTQLLSPHRSVRFTETNRAANVIGDRCSTTAMIARFLIETVITFGRGKVQADGSCINVVCTCVFVVAIVARIKGR